MAISRRPKRAGTWLTRLGLVAVLVVIIVGFRLAMQVGPERYPKDRFVVKEIVDGDTIELDGGDRLRLLAVDAPEADEPFFEEATSFLRDLLDDQPIRVVFDETRRDRYGRLLGYVYVDSVFVNEALLARGFGYVYLFSDNDRRRPEVGQLLAAQRQAMDERAGLWSLQHDPEDYYVRVKGKFRFHRPGCRDIRGIDPALCDTFESRDKPLRQGLSPCRNCRP